MDNGDIPFNGNWPPVNLNEEIDQQAIDALAGSDFPESTAGRPSNQQQYDNHMYGPDGQIYDNQGRSMNPDQDQDESRWEMGMDGVPVQVQPSAGFDLNRPDPRQNTFRPVRPSTNQAYGGFDTQQQNLYQPGPSMVGNGFAPSQPNPFDNPQQNPFQTDPMIDGVTFGSPYQPNTFDNPLDVPAVPGFGGMFQPGGGNYIPGQPLPQTGFDPLIPTNSAPYPFSSPLPYPGVVFPPAGRPQEEQPSIIGFSQLSHFVIAGSNSGPLDPQQHPQHRVPDRHEVLNYGTDDYDRQMMFYVDDGPQRAGESVEDYHIRVQRCANHMNLNVRKAPPLAPDADIATQDYWARTFASEEQFHRDSLANQSYANDWQNYLQDLHATNARRRANAVDHLRREYANAFPDLPDFPSPVDALYGDGDDNDRFTHASDGRPLPRAAPPPPAAGTGTAGQLPPGASGAAGQTKKRKRRGPIAEGTASEKRCEPCGQRSVACSIKDTGTPCNYCKEHGIEEQCVPRKLKRGGITLGTKRGPYKKSAKQLEKERHAGGNQQAYKYTKVLPPGERAKAEGQDAPLGGKAEEEKQDEVEEEEEDQDQDEDEVSDDEPETPKLPDDSDSDEPSTPLVVSGPSTSTRRNQPRAATRRPPPEEEEEEVDEEEQPAKKKRTAGLTRYTTIDGQRVLDPENEWNQRLGLVAPSTSNVASPSAVSPGNAAPPNAASPSTVSRSNAASPAAPTLRSMREGLRPRPGTGSGMARTRTNARTNARTNTRTNARTNDQSPARTNDDPPCANCQRKYVACDRERPCGNCQDDNEIDCDGVEVSAVATNPAMDAVRQRDQARRQVVERAQGVYTAPAPTAEPDEDEEMMDVVEPSMNDRIDHQRADMPNSGPEEVLEAQSQGWMGSREPSNADVAERDDDVMDEGGFFDQALGSGSQYGGGSQRGGNNSPNMQPPMW